MEKIKDLKTLVAFGTANRKSRTELYNLLERYYSMLPPNPDPMREQAQELISSLKRVENVYHLYHTDAAQVHLSEKAAAVGNLEAYVYTYHFTLRDTDNTEYGPITLTGLYIATQQHFYDTSTYDIIEDQPYNSFSIFIRDLIQHKYPGLIEQHGLPGVDADDRALQNVKAWNPSDNIDFMILIADNPRPIYPSLQDKFAFRIYHDPDSDAIPATWL